MNLVRFYCREHGYLCSAPAAATVICGQRATGRIGRRCNKRATTTKTERKVTA